MKQLTPEEFDKMWFNEFNWKQRRLDELFETKFSLKVAKRLEVFAFWYPKLQGKYGRR